jgi:alginate O-acetyltransferase complex protein AlgI
VLFPTIRFAIFFVVVMPASWLLMPLPSRGRALVSRDEDQPWMVPAALLALAAVLGPLAPWDGPTFLTALGWLAALGVGGLAVVRWLDLVGLVRWNVFMLVASYVFYGAYDWHFVAVLAGSTMVNQLLTARLHATAEERARRFVLVGGVTANLGLLAWFKYKGFFIESASSIFAPLGIDIDLPAGSVIPPVGISFFTFQALSYLIDTYRRRIEPSPLLDFAVYLSFFPHLVAGPIVRAAEFLPQLRTPRDARQVDTGLAFWLIAVGLFKKVVVSSYLASAIVDPVFRIPSQHQAVDTLLGIYGYAIQIYCDFSGYTDMAIGLALLLGFRFPQNFDAPYTATSLQDFWRRWHMTLSRWLRDYLYIPLGGSQRGHRRAYLNLFLTMLIGGLWHGAAWTFVVWGALHGGYLAVERWWSSRPVPAPHDPPSGFTTSRDDDNDTDTTGLPGFGDESTPDDPGLGRSGNEAVAVIDRLRTWQATRPPASPTRKAWTGRILTFHVVCLGWVFFRAPTLSEAFDVLARLFSLGTGQGVNLMVVATIAVFLATQFVPSDSVGRAQAAFSRLEAWQQGLLLAAFVMFTSALSPTGVAPFIYFAF